MIKKILCTSLLALGALNANAIYLKVYNNTNQAIVITEIAVCSMGGDSVCTMGYGFKTNPNEAVAPQGNSAKYNFPSGLDSWIRTESSGIFDAPVWYRLSVVRNGHKYNIPGDNYFWKRCSLDDDDTYVTLNYSGDENTSRMIIDPRSTGACTTDYYHWVT